MPVGCQVCRTPSTKPLIGLVFIRSASFCLMIAVDLDAKIRQPKRFVDLTRVPVPPKDEPQSALELSLGSAWGGRLKEMARCRGDACAEGLRLASRSAVVA